MTKKCEPQTKRLVLSVINVIYAVSICIRSVIKACPKRRNMRRECVLGSFGDPALTDRKWQRLFWLSGLKVSYMLVQVVRMCSALFSSGIMPLEWRCHFTFKWKKLMKRNFSSQLKAEPESPAIVSEFDLSWNMGVKIWQICGSVLMRRCGRRACEAQVWHWRHFSSWGLMASYSPIP